MQIKPWTIQKQEKPVKKIDNANGIGNPEIFQLLIMQKTQRSE